MKLLLRRDQRSGLLGKVIFTLDVRAEISDQERANIKKYKLGETEIFKSHDIADGTGMLARLAYKAIIINISVNDLANGKKVECKDILEMLWVEGQIKEAATTFAQVLGAAASFGGEELVEL
jgi:hypothetical protein